ncbi:6481_t:CDS:2 [Dentiscutata heterogama]|uniref:6481_t:CDS:1 n=1 Tax=Dentiscutata heterogama TaxID=1316150 RepID=A0ACA9L741_9GLOM|nr:6481_t:CDS:2 [Dentiscutata heterogama]
MIESQSFGIHQIKKWHTPSYLLACLNAPSDLSQKLQGKTNDIGDASENLILSKYLKSNYNEERLENEISKYLLKSLTDK